ncbi:hypothetical protein EYF80_042218 [Liparis tanakae]|uniref:Uncharacterized protein n=1 Tax=Liparis tanakae TaxID=230148 RepID=A0A4Z2G1Z2_9TELE|nr:hypothetical protein EYF80_042218 [Liparis tanakae]
MHLGAPPHYAVKQPVILGSYPAQSSAARSRIKFPVNSIDVCSNAPTAPQRSHNVNPERLGAHPGELTAFQMNDVRCNQINGFFHRRYEDDGKLTEAEARCDAAGSNKADLESRTSGRMFFRME